MPNNPDKIIWANCPFKKIRGVLSSLALARARMLLVTPCGKLRGICEGWRLLLDRLTVKRVEYFHFPQKNREVKKKLMPFTQVATLLSLFAGERRQVGAEELTHEQALKGPKCVQEPPLS